jgi:hypothetical protein
MSRRHANAPPATLLRPVSAVDHFDVKSPRSLEDEPADHGVDRFVEDDVGDSGRLEADMGKVLGGRTCAGHLAWVPG